MRKTIPIRVTTRTYRAIVKGANAIFFELAQSRKNRELVNELNRIATELKEKGASTK